MILPHDLTNPYYLPKPLFPNTIILGARASTYEFWRETNIESITMAIFISSILKSLFKSFAYFCIGLSSY